MFREILARAPDLVHRKDRWGCPAIEEALEANGAGQEKAVELLLRHGSDPPRCHPPLEWVDALVVRVAGERARLEQYLSRRPLLLWTVASRSLERESRLLYILPNLARPKRAREI